MENEKKKKKQETNLLKVKIKKHKKYIAIYVFVKEGWKVILYYTI